MTIIFLNDSLNQWILFPTNSLVYKLTLNDPFKLLLLSDLQYSFINYFIILIYCLLQCYDRAANDNYLHY